MATQREAAQANKLLEWRIKVVASFEFVCRRTTSPLDRLDRLVVYQSQLKYVCEYCHFSEWLSVNWCNNF